ncbi:MAG: hypothetical protein HZB91_12265 [Elusimicrobia bacterium]|nr:hypothetical protein [Elusimicrobiota bacterium]
MSRGRHDYHQFHPPRYRRGRPQLLDTAVISCAVLLVVAALFLAAKRFLGRGPAAPALPPAPPREAAAPPLAPGAASRTERPLDSIPAIELARTGKPTRKKVEVPVPK